MVDYWGSGFLCGRHIRSLQTQSSHFYGGSEGSSDGANNKPRPPRMTHHGTTDDDVSDASR